MIVREMVQPGKCFCTHVEPESGYLEPTDKPGIMTHICNSHDREAGAGRYLKLTG